MTNGKLSVQVPAPTAGGRDDAPACQIRRGHGGGQRGRQPGRDGGSVGARGRLVRVDVGGSGDDGGRTTAALAMAMARADPIMAVPEMPHCLLHKLDTFFLMLLV